MQYELGAVRAKDDFDIVGALPKQNIDTGMGLERMATLLQGVDNLYEIDEVYPVLERAAELTGKRYGAGPATSVAAHPDDVRLRVVADHVRSSLMLIGDGVTPGNEGRGYVLRRMLRRAVRSMRLLGVRRPVPAGAAAGLAGADERSPTPSSSTDFDRISQIAYAEEEAFRRTLAAGTTILDTAVARTKAAGGADAGRRPGVPAARHLRLPDRPHPGDGRRAGPRRSTRRASAASCRSSASGPRPTRRPRRPATATPSVYRDLADGARRATDFTGYDELVSEGRGRGLVVDGEPRRGEPAPATSSRSCSTARRSTRSRGGQIADAGASARRRRRHRGRRRAAPGQGARRAQRRRVLGEVRCAGAPALARSTPSAAAISPRRTPARTSCTRRCARCSARGPVRLGQQARLPPARLPPRPRCPRRSLARDRGGANPLCATTCRSPRDVMPLDAGPRARAPSRCSARRTARTCASSRSASWAASSAVAPTCSTRARSALSRCSASRRSAPACAASRRSSATDALRYLARERAIVAELTEPGRRVPRSSPSGSARMVTRLKDAERELERLRAGAGAGAAAGLARRARATSTASPSSATTPATPVPTTCAPWCSTCAAGSAPTAPASCAITGAPRAGRSSSSRPTRRPASAASGPGRCVRVAAAALGGGGGGKDDIAQGGGQDASKVRGALGRRVAPRGAPADRESTRGDRRGRMRGPRGRGSVSTSGRCASGSPSSDPDGILATPVATVPRDPAPGRGPRPASPRSSGARRRRGGRRAAAARSRGTKGAAQRGSRAMLPCWRRASPRSGCDSSTSA